MHSVNVQSSKIVSLETRALISTMTFLISTLYHLASRLWTDLKLATVPQQSLSGRWEIKAEDRCMVST